MFTLIIGITLWYLTGLIFNRQNIYYAFDKRATLPLRGILALLIVLHHFRILYPEDYWCLSDLGFVGAPVCSVFFFLSGYGLMTSFWVDPISSLRNFPTKRILKLAPPMVLVILLNVFIHMIEDLFNAGSVANVFEYSKYIFMPHFWFVIVLMGCYFIFYFSSRLLKKPIHILISVGIIIGLYCILMSNIDDYATFWWVSTPGFFVGMCVVFIEKKKYMLHSTSSHVFSILLIAISSIYYVIGFYNNILPIWGLQYICLLPIMVFVCTLQLPIYSNCVLNYMGKLSYEIYLVHVTVLITLRPLIENNLIFLISTLIVTILLSKVIYKISDCCHA